MIAIFIAPLSSGQPQLPPMDDSNGGTQLVELVNGQRRDGCGYSVIGQVPQAPTCIVRVDSSAATITAMKADAAYLWIEDVEVTNAGI